VFGTGEVFEPVLAEVLQDGSVRQRVLDEFRGSGGKQDLATVGGGLQPGHPVDDRAEVVTVSFLGFAGVQNFPTVGLIDGILRLNLEETGMSYGLEVDMIAKYVERLLGAEARS